MANHLKILLVDDDEDDRDIFAIALKTAQPDARLYTAENGPECLKKLTEEALVPDFIFIDLNMPYMRGGECLIEIKKMAHLQAVPAIIYTTSSNKDDAEYTKNAGASNYLVKPTSLKALSDILGQIMEGGVPEYFIKTAD